MAHHKIVFTGLSTVEIDGSEYSFYENSSLYYLTPTLVISDCSHSHNYENSRIEGSKYNCLLAASKLVNKWLERKWEGK
jgi:hypothetical protein